MGYLLILIKTAINLSESVLIKKYNTKHNAGGMFFTGILSLFALLFFVIYDKDGFNFPSEMLPYAVAYGILYCVSYFLTFVALANGSFTLSMLIISYSLIFPIIFGIIRLHDPVSFFTCAGFVLLMISLFLVRREKSENEKDFSVKWLIAIVIAMAGNGVLAILQKVQQVRFDNTCNNEFMIVALSVSAALLLGCGAVKDRKDLKEIVRYGIPYAGTAGVANGINLFMGLLLNNLLPLSIISPAAAGVRVVMSFLISRTIFKEKYLKRQIFGVVLGALALICLNL